MEQGPSFRVSVPKYATKDPNYRILARQRSRFTRYYFYLRDQTLGPMVMRVASFFQRTSPSRSTRSGARTRRQSAYGALFTSGWRRCRTVPNRTVPST
jgi:hypothetical protein